jgi:hypothetical protein
MKWITPDEIWTKKKSWLSRVLCMHVWGEIHTIPLLFVPRYKATCVKCGETKEAAHSIRFVNFID